MGISHSQHLAFTPAWWLRHRHLQTIFPNLTRRRMKVDTHHQRLELPDGDFVDLNWTNQHKGRGSPIVIVLHGLGGSIESKYVQSILRETQTNNWRGLLMHFRGASASINRLPRSYHAGDIDDIYYLISKLHLEEPQCAIFVVGYSIGGSVLLNLLGRKKNLPIKAAIAVSVPYNLHQAAINLDRGFSRIYQTYILRSLKEKTISKFSGTKVPFDVKNISRLKNFREFDDTVTAPLHGFAGVDDYYQRCSAKQYLTRIDIPTLLIHASDDPFMSPQCAPTQLDVSEKITLEVYKRGGHVGFISGRYPWRPIYWLDKRIPVFIRQQLEMRARNIN